MTEKSRSERGGRRRFNLKRREACTGWLFVSPALIGFSIFTFGSILYSLYLSFTDYNLLSKPNWLGLQNYVKAFTDDQYFYPYFGNTFYFVVALVPIVLVVSLLLAILINKKAGRLTKGYRVALFLPSITSTVAVSMVWLWIFNPDMGILNNILTAIGLNDVPLWLGDPAWSKPALVIMRVWQMSRLLYADVPCRAADHPGDIVRSRGCGRRYRMAEIYPHYGADALQYNVCGSHPAGDRGVQHV